MSTATSPYTPTSAAPAPRLVSFDALKHAAFFHEDKLTLSASRNGHPQLIVETQTVDGLARAGTITFVPAQPATLAGRGLPASLAITGRMAEFTEVQREELRMVGVTFKPTQGIKKTFWTAYLPEHCLDHAEKVFAALKTKNGKGCAMGQFTSRAINLFRRRMVELRS
jgi:hypothetical protein